MTENYKSACYRSNPTLQGRLRQRQGFDSLLHLSRKTKFHQIASRQSAGLDEFYFHQQPLGSNNGPDSSKHLEIRLNMFITACLNILPCRVQLFHWSVWGYFSWSPQCKGERCSLESFLWKSLWILTRGAEGTVTYCEAIQRNWQRCTKCSTAKIQSEHRQINVCLQSRILIHLQCWLPTFITSAN